LPDIFAYASLIEELAQHILKEKTGKKKVPKILRIDSNWCLGSLSLALQLLRSFESYLQINLSPYRKHFPKIYIPFSKFEKELLEGEKIFVSQSENFASNMLCTICQFTELLLH